MIGKTNGEIKNKDKSATNCRNKLKKMLTKIYYSFNIYIRKFWVYNTREHSYNKKRNF